MRLGGKRKSPHSRGGALVLIATLLVGSGLVRIGTEAGPALARSIETSQMPDKAHPEEANAPDRDGMHALLQALQERESRLAERERMLEERAHALDIAEEAVDRKLGELVQAETALRETLALADGAVENDIARLTTVYETMKPKEAAALFEEMAPEFAAGFLSRMRPDAAAEVMTGLSPDVAYTISVVMAGRNGRAPIE